MFRRFLKASCLTVLSLGGLLALSGCVYEHDHGHHGYYRYRNYDHCDTDWHGRYHDYHGRGWRR